LKPYRIFLLPAVLWLAACAAGSHAISKAAPDSPVATQQLAEAMNLVAEKNWPQAVTALRTIIEAKTFGSLSGDFKYRTLSTAGRVAFYHGPPQLGYEYFGRVIAMPQADFGDWLERLRAAAQLGNEADSVSTLTVIMQRWPDRGRSLNPDYILKVAHEAKRLPRAAAFPLLQALYDAHWKLKWDIEPSATWRDLALLLLEKHRLTDAVDVAGHVTDVYVLIAMRADRHFDAVVAANPPQFDIEAAAEREFHAFQTAAEKAPQSLELKSHVIDALLRQQHYEAALAASDAILLDIQSTNFPKKLYEDYDEQAPWFLNYRDITLERVGRWDEALAQLTAASLMFENHESNVSQLINLGYLYCELRRPDDALAAIGGVAARTSADGTMQLEEVRLEAAEQLGDTQQVERSLQYLRLHRADAPAVYESGLIVVNQPARAAHELVARLLDPDRRQDALLEVQIFATPPGTPQDMELEARQRAMIARPEVQAAIRKVGRVASYRLEEPSY
jgi:tetratricopeptide (TPR) repeat protein